MKAYVRPEVEVILFSKEDVICASPGDVIIDKTERHAFVPNENYIEDLTKEIKG